MDIKTNIELSNCITQANGFTGKTIYNICNDTKTYVPYGAIDYVGPFGVLVSLFLFIGFVSFLIYTVTTTKL